jgi:hypothetical protein
VTFLAAPTFGDEGHALFTMSGIPLWTRYVDEFLKAQNLVLRSSLLPIPPVPHVPAPRELSPAGQRAFQLYLAAPGEKAFAIAPDGYWGYEFGRRTADEARNTAMGRCQLHGATCRIVMVNDEAIR